MSTIPTSLFEKFLEESQLDGNSLGYLEDLYEAYLADPTSIDEKWASYFSSLPRMDESVHERGHGAVRAKFKNAGLKLKGAAGTADCSADTAKADKQVRVLQLINAYRLLGHMKANTNPLEEDNINWLPELSLEYHNLSPEDLDIEFNTGSLFAPDHLPLNKIVGQLEGAYCDSIGSQYMYISDTAEKRWLQEHLEGLAGQELSSEERISLLKSLISAETLERYLHSRYVGQKRFSLEGGDSLIPMLDELVQHSGKNGCKEIVIGMAHRGRLNVLINIMGKSPADLFREFEGQFDDDGRSGDVKYHLGYSSDMKTPGGPVHIAMAFNPSHLEIVGPVVVGAARARQDRRDNKEDHSEVIPVVIHGDAALAGQGVNMEMLNMSETRGYRTHGTIHIVVNNQIGFTTSTKHDARSTEYCTDLVKMVEAPVFHVNGDDPEAVIRVTRLAVDYRKKYKRDVVIDLVCYRRHGHNEADEPAATQPMMYKKIRALPTTQARYAEDLISDGVITKEQANKFIADYRDQLGHGAPTVPHLLGPDDHNPYYPVNWDYYKGGAWDEECDTTITPEQYKHLGQKLTVYPEDEGFKLNSRVKGIVGKRLQMANGEIDADWGFGENLAYAALCMQDVPVRLSGEDCGRGTFFHRHAVFHDQDTGNSYLPLRNLSDKQEEFVVIDSLLSEEAVLAFEYGYATTEAKKLVIWEAQFGDFANGAQVVIDQFISSAEQKWGLLSGLVMLLPHGYEGQGPEHSSARLERFMQLCAQENMQVCVPSTPAQVFHMLRRQALRRYRRPLVVMTPKSLLRHPLAVNPMEDFTERGFQNVIGEIDDINPADVKRVVFCSGKVYYELLQKRRSEEVKDVAIIRLEQLYPFPEADISKVLEEYSHVEHFVWCQEEPFNQGAWLSIQPWLRTMLGGFARLDVASRPPMAAPAEGSSKAHLKAQERLLQTALGLTEPTQGA